jgi:hypothetical protein
MILPGQMQKKADGFAGGSRQRPYSGAASGSESRDSVPDPRGFLELFWRQMQWTQSTIPARKSGVKHGNARKCVINPDLGQCAPQKTKPNQPNLN